MQNPPDPPEEQDEEEGRPGWHWIGFGVVAIFAAWLPLVYVAGALTKSAVASFVGDPANEVEVAARIAAMSASERVKLGTVQALPHVLALGLAAFAGGYLVGRFGKETRTRDAAMAGGAAVVLALALAWRTLALGGIGAVLAVVLPGAIAVGFAAWGGRTGTRARDKRGS